MAERKSRASEPNKATDEAKVDDKVDEPTPRKAAPNAAPMDAPKKPQPEPELPIAMESTGVAPMAPSGEASTRLLGEDGSELNIMDCLEYPGIDDPGVLVTVNQRIFREYTHPHSVTKMVQLVHPKGAIITKADAKRLRDEHNPPSEEPPSG